MTAQNPSPPLSDGEASCGESKKTLTVYFDGACPLCQREIAFYRKKAGAELITWIDVSRPSAEGQIGQDLCRKEALSRFHVRRPDGRLESGAAAFGLLWSSLPRFRWMGRLVSLPGMTWTADRLYDLSLMLRPGLQRWVAKLTDNASPGRT